MCAALQKLTVVQCSPTKPGPTRLQGVQTCRLLTIDTHNILPITALNFLQVFRTRFCSPPIRRHKRASCCHWWFGTEGLGVLWVGRGFLVDSSFTPKEVTPDWSVSSPASVWAPRWALQIEDRHCERGGRGLRGGSVWQKNRLHSLCARGEGERMRRLMGFVGEDGTGDVTDRIRRSGAGDLGRGLLGHRSGTPGEAEQLGCLRACMCVCEWSAGFGVPCLGGRAGALGKGLDGAQWRILSPFSSLAETYADDDKCRNKMQSITALQCYMSVRLGLCVLLIFSSYGSSSRKGWSVPAVFSTRASMTSWRVAQGI